MSDQPEKAAPPQAVLTAAPAQQEQTDSNGPNATRMILLVIGGLVAVFVLGFLVALLFALTNPAAAAGFAIIRDFFIIVMALEGIIIGAALAVLVLQLARLTNLLQNEIKPILEQTNDTVKTVKGTADFVSRNVTQPVIRATGLFSWVSAFMREFWGLSRALRRQGRSVSAGPAAPANQEGAAE